MIRLLQWLFVGHVHHWKTIIHKPLVTENHAGRVVAQGERYVQQCDGCGIVVKRDLI